MKETLKSTFACLAILLLLGACADKPNLDISLSTGSGSDLGTLEFNEEGIVSIKGVANNSGDSTRILFGINFSQLMPTKADTSSLVAALGESGEFDIYISRGNPFLKEGENEMTIVRLDGEQQREGRYTFTYVKD